MARSSVVRVCVMIGSMSLQTALAADSFSLTVSDERVEIEFDSQPLTTYFYNTKWPKPFLFPIRSPTGIKITRNYPMEVVPGEDHEHPWHRGLWFGHGDIQGVDFWREVGGNRSSFPLPVGHFAFRALERAETTNESAIVSASYDLKVGGGESLGTVKETFVFRRHGGNNIIDVRITILADQGTCLKLGDTEEGTFAIRLRNELREDEGGATLLNAYGEVGTKKIWGKSSPWVDYSSVVEGKEMGVAILDHPQNPKYPTHWHARGYGLFSANPFGEHDFHGDPERDGGVTIPAGANLDFHYRVIVHPGDAESAGVARLFKEYATEN